MFGDLLRRLTADYTEEEYKEWLNEPSTPNKYYSPISGEERVKDIACDLACVAEDTGYEPEFLYQMFDEEVEDRMSMGDSFAKARRLAFASVVGISYEQDW